MPTVLTRKEAADYLRISLPTIDRWVRDGKIPSFQAHGCHRRLFNKEQLDQMLTEKERKHD